MPFTLILRGKLGLNMKEKTSIITRPQEFWRKVKRLNTYGEKGNMMSFSKTVRRILAEFTRTHVNLHGYEFVLVLIDGNVAQGISFWIGFTNIVLCRLISNYKPKYTADLQNVPIIVSPKIMSLRSENLTKLGYKHESIWLAHIPFWNTIVKCYSVNLQAF